MPRIHRLPPEVVNRIAAGEVIERPASVVKELVENAIDADATEVLIDLDQGGTQRITVRDNGCGMDPEDLVLAFESHATSKLSAQDVEADLYGISTLGFRGEALPSIAAVGEVEALSRARGGECAFRLRVGRGGPEPAAGETGTVVEVRNLFYKVPARRKFLRATSAELARVLEQVTHIALAYPAIRFLVTHQGRRSLDLPACGSLHERLVQVVGVDRAKELFEVAHEGHVGEPRLHGFVGSPQLRRGDARQQSFFVDGRWVRDRTLSAALRAAYQGYLIPGNHPVAYLFLEFPAGAVDINVHPQKSEVRFRDPGALYSLVYHAVARALERGGEGGDESGGGAESRALEQDSARERIEQAALDFFAAPPRRPRPASDTDGRSARPVEAAERTDSEDSPDGDAAAEPSMAPRPPRRAFQVLDAYILVEDGDGIVLIDQHALHEKILFEEIHPRLCGGSVVRQKLLVPEVVALRPDQAPLLEEARELLESCGYEVEPFGEHDVVIHAVPVVFERGAPGASASEVVLEIFRWLAEEPHGGEDRAGGGPELLERRLRTVASLMACKQAVKAGSRLAPQQIDDLLARARIADDPRHCPHGRPTTIRLSAREIERKFDRK